MTATFVPSVIFLGPTALFVLLLIEAAIFLVASLRVKAQIDSSGTLTFCNGLFVWSMPASQIVQFRDDGSEWPVFGFPKSEGVYAPCRRL